MKKVMVPITALHYDARFDPVAHAVFFEHGFARDDEYTYTFRVSAFSTRLTVKSSERHRGRDFLRTRRKGCSACSMRTSGTWLLPR